MSTPGAGVGTIFKVLRPNSIWLCTGFVAHCGHTQDAKKFPPNRYFAGDLGHGGEGPIHRQPCLAGDPGQDLQRVTNYGAIGDGVATNTVAIQAAIDAASTAGGGTVEVPAGVFLSGPIHLASQINLRVDEGATLEMLPLDKYPGGTEHPDTFISGAGLRDVVISGAGTIEGRGTPWWPFRPGARGAAAPDDRAIRLQESA